MFTIISLGTFSGYRIDIYFEISNSIFTIIFSLISIATSLIYVIRKTKEIGN